MFYNWIVVIVVQLCKFSKTRSIVHLKQVNFMVCKLYLNKVFFFKGKAHFQEWLE